MLRLRGSAAAWVLGLLLAVSGCGFEGELPTPPTPPSPPAPPTQAGIVLSLSSSPIDAVAAADGSAPWSAEWTLTIQETSGIGGNIDFVRATLADAAGAKVAETELDVEQVSEQLGGTNHIRGGSNQQIPMSLSFDFPADSPSAELRVTLQLSDDRGNTISAAVEAVIQVCVPSLSAPEDGGVMDNGCTNEDNGISWEFDWDDCAAAESYEIHLSHPSFEQSLDLSGLTSSSFTVLEDRVIPEESRIGWVWRVRATVNGVSGNFSPERTFDVEPANTDCVVP